ncbi:aldehyde dehydrogenase family protein [Microbacterium testaceum]|uniref:aldehyde dehydrogenase family protein n=1 Tax=Microbacterium testaceum TaxID=2033 RepID=UPI0019D37C26|nr:aldehyde dehydrogenase family protein [Microbacterium testaceum]
MAEPPLADAGPRPHPLSGTRSGPLTGLVAASVIDGEEVDAAARGTSAGAARRIPVISARTLEEMGEVVEADEHVVDRAVRAARAAFPAWAATPLEERAAILSRAAEVIAARGARIAELVTAEMGMPIALAQASQWHLPAQVLRTTADRALDARALAWRQPIEGAVLHRRPSGVVAAISPWNMPTYQTVAKVAAALVAGCTVVVKPSAQTPFDGQEFVALLHAAGVPAGAVQLVQGSGGVTGAALAAHPDLAHVSFTGSVEAGRTVARLAAGSLARCTLELGGKSPALVLPSADLSRAIPAVLGSGLVNSGQACNATTRLLVPAARAAEAEDLIRAHAAGFTLGDPFDPAVGLGPLSSVRHGESVVGFAERALADGGRAVTGSPRRAEIDAPGFFVAPLVLAGLERSAEAVQEEIFGPVLVVQPYRDLDDAIDIAHDSRFGLSAEVWGDPAEAVGVAERLHVGQVKVNGVRTRERPGVPFGGVGESGYGRELGALGIEEFTDVTAVMA